MSLPTSQPPSSTATSCTYAYTGAEQTFTVPAGVTSVTVTAVGARGVNGGAAAGGNGAVVTATVPVPTGTATLYVEVGGPGDLSTVSDSGNVTGPFNGGGWSNYAGNGGGGSDVRTCSMSTCDLTSNDTRLVVAGNGGGGSYCPQATGGQAGDSSVTGPGAATPSGNCSAALAGGNGGFGGTAGGAGADRGGDGSLGQGGIGTDFELEDGPGGGGYYGGGACGGTGGANSGGGGAGSSFWVPAATGTSMTTDTTGTSPVLLIRRRRGHGRWRGGCGTG